MIECQSCGFTLDTDFGIVLCPSCGYQNIFVQEDPVVENFGSDSSKFSDVEISIEESGDLMDELEVRDHLVEREPVGISSGEPEPQDSFGLNQVSFEDPDETRGEEAATTSIFGDTHAETLESSSDIELTYSMEGVSEREPPQAIDELIAFGNSDEVVGTQIVFDLIISEINLAAERELVLVTLQNHHVDETQLQMNLSRGEIGVQRLSAAKLAKIIKDLGGQDVEYHVTQGSL